MTIKKFSIEYDAINRMNIFTSGDIISGRIIVEASKETKIQELIFTAKANAEVCWSEQHGDNTYVYRSSEKYYDISHYILRKARQDGTEVIGPGRHLFPFSFNIPNGRIPPTYKSSVGKIVHKLKAELKQSMKLTKTAKTHFTFVPKADMEIPGLLEPQHGCKDKTISVFGSGTVSFDVYTERLGYWQGEAIQVTVDIKNQSSRDVKPKILLYQKKSYFAQGHRRMHTKDMLKEKCELVASHNNTRVTKVIPISPELPPSLLNCSIIRLEYKLKIHLDIKCAINPVIKLPIVVLAELSDTTLGTFTNNTAAFKVKEDSARAYPSQSTAQQQYPAVPFSDDPPPYGAHAMYPTYPQTNQNGTLF